MNCQEVAHGELAEGYLQGRLDPALQDDFEAHILECEKCLREVEALQAVRDDLAIRAHEIRAYSVSRGRLRWSWVAVAALFLLVTGLGVRQFLQRQNAGVAQQKPPQQNVAAPGTQEKSGSSETVSKAPEQPPQSAKRNPIETLAAGIPKKPPPPQAKQETTVERSTPPTPVVATNPENPPAPGSQVATAPETAAPPMGPKSPTTQIATATPPELMSDEGERELFRLSSARPAPYDFSGVSSHGSISPGSGARGGQTSLSGEQRAMFERAMRDYLNRDYNETIDLLQRVLVSDPNAPDANFYLGVTLLLKGRPDLAFAPLKVAASNRRTRWSQPGHFYLAKAYLQTRDLASAETELKAAAAITGSLTASARTDLASLQALRSKENR